MRLVIELSDHLVRILMEAHSDNDGYAGLPFGYWLEDDLRETYGIDPMYGALAEAPKESDEDVEPEENQQEPT